ncbi:MAG: hypothetical protein MJZ20_08025 [Bacteroidaceae bacterium]|nr:hypothetical protein [Bacteroidaceae bacterium]
MIIKYRVPNPALKEDYPNDMTKKFAESNHIDDRAWFYSDNIASFWTYNAVDGMNEIRTMMEVVDGKTHEHSVFYLSDTAYVMNDDGKTIETIVPYRKPIEKAQK